MNPSVFYPGPLSSFIASALFFINYYVVPLIFALAFFGFLWGVYTYFFSVGADAEKRTKGKTFVLYSVIGFVLMLSIWGIVNVLMGTLGFNAQSRPSLPLFGSSGNSAQNGFDSNATSGYVPGKTAAQCVISEGTIWIPTANGGQGGCYRSN